MSYRKINKDEVQINRVVYTKNITGSFSKGHINDISDTFISIGFQRQSYVFSIDEVYLKIDDDREEKLNVLVK